MYSNFYSTTKKFKKFSFRFDITIKSVNPFIWILRIVETSSNRKYEIKLDNELIASQDCFFCGSKENDIPQMIRRIQSYKEYVDENEKKIDDKMEKYTSLDLFVDLYNYLFGLKYKCVEEEDVNTVKNVNDEGDVKVVVYFKRDDEKKKKDEIDLDEKNLLILRIQNGEKCVMLFLSSIISFGQRKSEFREKKRALLEMEKEKEKKKEKEKENENEKTKEIERIETEVECLKRKKEEEEERKMKEKAQLNVIDRLVKALVSQQEINRNNGKVLSRLRNEVLRKMKRKLKGRDKIFKRMANEIKKLKMKVNNTPRPIKSLYDWKKKIKK